MGAYLALEQRLLPLANVAAEVPPKWQVNFFDRAFATVSEIFATITLWYSRLYKPGYCVVKHLNLTVTLTVEFVFEVVLVISVRSLNCKRDQFFGNTT